MRSGFFYYFILRMYLICYAEFIENDRFHEIINKVTRLKNLYNELGEPKRIRCYMIKRKPYPTDYITVVFTHVSGVGYPTGVVLFRAMNRLPFSPLGFCQWGEALQHNFKPGGSRVKFSDLPKDCREVALRDYKELWESSA